MRRCSLFCAAFCVGPSSGQFFGRVKTYRLVLIVVLGSLLLPLSTNDRAVADDIHVSNEAELDAALQSAQDGDRILLAAGTYQGGFFQAGLTGVEILSADSQNQAIIQGGTNGIQLSDATRVTLSHLIFQNQTGNGINIDDGGSFASPSTDVVIRDVVVRDISTTGNRDGIKLSGVTGFVIDNVRVSNWGDGGSAVDLVGSHHGLIQNSHFFSQGHTSDSRIVGPKGGSKDITIRANRIEIIGDKGRGIQAGGSTDAQFYRFIDGDSGYEASEIKAEGNVIIGGSSSFSFVNIDGGQFHHNLIDRPQDWLIRILNENQGESIVDTQNGQLTHNVFVFNDTASEFKKAVNIGDETLPATFYFERNQWYNLADPSDSEPDLPSEELDGIYGVEPDYTINDAVAWEFDWGVWAVNAVDGENTFILDSFENFQLATPGLDADFDPLANDPFIGDWTFNELSSGQFEMGSFSQRHFRAVPEVSPFFLTCAALIVFLCLRGRRIMRQCRV